MRVDVVLLPSFLHREQLIGHTAVVFDVLRATTTMTAALAAGIREVRLFGDLESAQTAAGATEERILLCGERHAIKPPGFDLGNSPGQFNPAKDAGRVLFMSTTNGTRALLAAAEADHVLAGALVNADAVAEVALQLAKPVTLLCSGTEGEISGEDVLGAGAVLTAIASRTEVELGSDSAWIAREAFRANAHRLPEALTQTRGGKNVIRANLRPDIDFAARLNSMRQVGAVVPHTTVLRLWSPTA